MPKFAVVKLEEIVGRITFYKLEVDGVCPFDDFFETIKMEGNMVIELQAIFKRFDDIANLRQLPGTKYHPLKGCKDKWTEYEIKTKHLRVYLFHVPDTGKIIVMGGKKTSQKQDINRLRKLKEQYKNQK